MNASNIQQAVSGFRTHDVFCGLVRVHEALDAGMEHTPHRYLISVDFKFREFDALNVGKLGWLGMTKSEATREAKTLANRLAVAIKALDAAKKQALNWDTFTNRYTVKMQEQTYNKIAGRYTAEFIQ